MTDSIKSFPENNNKKHEKKEPIFYINIGGSDSGSGNNQPTKETIEKNLKYQNKFSDGLVVVVIRGGEQVARYEVYQGKLYIVTQLPRSKKVDYTYGYGTPEIPPKKGRKIPSRSGSDREGQQSNLSASHTNNRGGEGQ